MEIGACFCVFLPVAFFSGNPARHDTSTTPHLSWLSALVLFLSLGYHSPCFIYLGYTWPSALTSFLSPLQPTEMIRNQENSDLQILYHVLWPLPYTSINIWLSNFHLKSPQGWAQCLFSHKAYLHPKQMLYIQIKPCTYNIILKHAHP